MPTLSLAQTLAISIGQRAKDIYPLASVIVMLAAIAITWEFHALAAFPPSISPWTILIADLMMLGSIHLVLHCFAEAITQRDSDWRWLIFWLAVTVPTSLLLSADFSSVVTWALIAISTALVQWTFISVSWIPYPYTKTRL